MSGQVSGYCSQLQQQQKDQSPGWSQEPHWTMPQVIQSAHNQSKTKIDLVIMSNDETHNFIKFNFCWMRAHFNIIRIKVT